jgi:hypothetical protein
MNAVQYDCHAKMYCLTPECYSTRGCPWLNQGRPEAPRHVRLSEHGGVNGLRDSDGRWMDGERASGAGCATVMGDGWMARERVVQVARQ